MDHNSLRIDYWMFCNNLHKISFDYQTTTKLNWKCWIKLMQLFDYMLIRFVLICTVLWNGTNVGMGIQQQKRPAIQLLYVAVFRARCILYLLFGFPGRSSD